MDKKLKFGKNYIDLKNVDNVDDFIINFENNIFFYNQPRDTLSLSNAKFIFPEYLKKTNKGIYELNYKDALLINLNNLYLNDKTLYPLNMVYISFNSLKEENIIKLTDSDFLENRVFLVESGICGKIKDVFEEGKIRVGCAFNPSRLSNEIFR